MNPAFEWFEAKFAEPDLAKQMEAFKFVRLLDPSQWHLVAALSGDLREDLSGLLLINGITDYVIKDMVKQLPRYLAAAQSDPRSNYLPHTHDGEGGANALWWDKHGPDVPAWNDAFRACLLLIPSSCSAERVFSMLKATFSSNQERALNDLRELSVMLQFNSHQAKRYR